MIFLLFEIYLSSQKDNQFFFYSFNLKLMLFQYKIFDNFDGLGLFKDKEPHKLKSLWPMAQDLVDDIAFIMWIIFKLIEIVDIHNFFCGILLHRIKRKPADTKLVDTKLS